MKKRITIRDVAAQAGVSVATVSNVLNGIDKASTETKERVMRVMEELRFSPDITARSLSSGKSKLVAVVAYEGMVVADVSLILRDNPFYFELSAGVEAYLRKNGYHTIITGMGEGDDYVGFIKGRRLDGIIFVGDLPEKTYQKVKNTGIPIVFVDNYEMYSPEVIDIGIDDMYGGYMATKHLIELGHRNIAFVSGGIKESFVNTKRFAGYQKALEENGIEINERYIFEKWVNLEGGMSAGEEVLKIDEITAVFAVADIMAFGVIKAFSANGKRVPDDYSIVGFDDIAACRYMDRELTTVSQNSFMKGVKAAEKVVEIINNKSKASEKINLPIELIIRNTTKEINTD